LLKVTGPALNLENEDGDDDGEFDGEENISIALEYD
jgi:hypothetical protein